MEIILEILRVEFVMDYCLRQSKHQLEVRMACSRILRRISHDIKLLNSFLKENINLITTKHELSFHIN